jgi:hypothetical protein
MLGIQILTALISTNFDENAIEVHARHVVEPNTRQDASKSSQILEKCYFEKALISC